MSQMAILFALRKGAMTNRQLQDEVGDHSASIARTCAKLISDGRVIRVDGDSGRGKCAIYALPGNTV